MLSSAKGFFVLGQPGGRGGKIRTCGLTVPNRAHYQAVLRPEFHYGIYRRKNVWSSQTPIKSSIRRIICLAALPRWLSALFSTLVSSPNVRPYPSGMKIGS
jgi:hypothetical protein